MSDRGCGEKNWADKAAALVFRRQKHVEDDDGRRFQRKPREKNFGSSREPSEISWQFSRLPLDVPINRAPNRAIDFTSLKAASVLFLGCRKPSCFSIIDWSVVNGHDKCFGKKKVKKWFFQNPIVWCQVASAVAAIECRINLKSWKFLRKGQQSRSVGRKIFFLDGKRRNFKHFRRFSFRKKILHKIKT